MKVLIGCVACFVAGSSLGLVGSSLDGGADVSTASLLPVTVTPHVEPVVVTRTLGRFTTTVTAPPTTRVETRTATTTVTSTPERETVTETVTTTKAKDERPS